MELCIIDYNVRKESTVHVILHVVKYEKENEEQIENKAHDTHNWKRLVLFWKAKFGTSTIWFLIRVLEKKKKKYHIY